MTRWVVWLLVVLVPVKGVNFISSAVLPDGEHGVRMRFGNTLVKETSITEDQEDSRHRVGMMLRQVNAGPLILQLIYEMKRRKGANSLRLAQCEILEDWPTANDFRSNFQKELTNAGLSLTVPTFKDTDNMTLNLLDEDPLDLEQAPDDLRNVTVRILSDEEVDGDLKKAFDVTMQKRRCLRLHRKLEKAANETRLHKTKPPRRKREAIKFGMMPGTYWCGNGNLTEKYKRLGAHVGLDYCCRQHDGCPFVISSFGTEYGLFNYRMKTLSHCACDESGRRRGKRELGDPFQVPGTLWCGRGSSANESTQLGGFTGADKCCRYHDSGCPFFVESFEEKYGLFNWRMYTLNHCTCDERFRSCLKMTNSGAANFVGKLYFNIVQSKCFFLKPEKSCTKRTWWGKCLKYELKKQAYLKDPLPY